MSLIKQLKEYNGNLTADTLPIRLKTELINWHREISWTETEPAHEREPGEEELMRTQIKEIIEMIERCGELN